jgi:signal transduction histidine kinase
MRPAFLAMLTAGLLVGIFAAVVLRFRSALREEIHQSIIDRDAAVLLPVAQRQLAERSAAHAGTTDLLAAVLESAQQEDMIGVAIFDEQGHTLRFAPSSMLFAELPLEDYIRLLKSGPISRYFPDFPLGQYFAGVRSPPAAPTPVLEVLLPLRGRDPGTIAGFAQYYIDARPLSVELGTIDRRIARQTAATLTIGAGLIALVVIAAFLGLRRAQRLISERNERLVRANAELTLSAKASALGQITSHLVHGLQGSVSSLRGVVAGRDPSAAAASDWQNVSDYTDRMQGIIQETVALLGDAGNKTSYELTADEMAVAIERRNSATAAEKGVRFSVNGKFGQSLDSHRGGLLCLIIGNLAQNAIAATSAGNSVTVTFRRSGDTLCVAVSDDGPGIPEELRAHLFEPGRSGRAGGSGLGLAISQLLARQIGAALSLDATGPNGTTFNLTIPLAPA